MSTRDRLIAALDAGLRREEFIRAAWLGGSDATGRADERSDVDICLIVAPGQVEPAAAAIERAVERVAPIRLRLRLPMPTWHGFDQAFYQLDGLPEETMVDWVIVEAGRPHPWLEVERHGQARVLFDKDGVLVPAHVDRAAIDAAVRKKVEELRVKFQLFRHLPVKLSERGLPVDAAYFYQAVVLRPLVDLLRCVHCPERWDFGFRYVRDDLPRGVYAALEGLMYPSGAGQIAAHAAAARAMFEAAMAEWEAREKKA